MANPTPRVSLVASVSGRVGAAGSAPKVAPGPPIVTPSTRPVVATAAAPAGSITAEDWLRRSAKPAVGGGDGNAGGGAVSGGGGGGVDMLVHVVSHKDFCLSVEHDAGDSACLPPFVKPTFSKFQPVAEAVLAHIDSLGTDGVHIITHPLHDGNATPKAQRADDEDEVPVGLAFDKPLEWPTWDDFHVRKSALKVGDGPRLTGMYFPLLPLVLLGWQHNRDVNDDERRPMICLVSGSGQPNNADHNPMGNSTRGIAQLMERWMNIVSASVTVHQASSDHGIFRFDSNIEFVNSQLVPIISNELRPLVLKYGADWEEHFALTMSLCDGPPARLWAVNAGLRRFKPGYLHLYELKSFWYEMVLNEHDMDYHPFSSIEAHPPTSLSTVDAQIKKLVLEMKAHREDYLERAQHDSRNEMAGFWLRKTKKPVLSVLMVQKDASKPPQYLRGINMEVSMPTGSLCSERNVIGSAFAADLSLRREHLKMIAVLSMPQLKPTSGTVAPLQRSSSVSSETSFMPPLALPATADMPNTGAGVGAGAGASATQQRLPAAAQPAPSAGSLTWSTAAAASAASSSSAAVSSSGSGGRPPAASSGADGARASVKRRRSDSMEQEVLVGVMKRPSLGSDASAGSAPRVPVISTVRLLPKRDPATTMREAAVFIHTAGAGAPVKATQRHSTESDRHKRTPSPRTPRSSNGSPRSPIIVPLNASAHDRYRSSASVLGTPVPGRSSYRRSTWYNEQATAAKALNPIAPCGACNEWLKKISEVNPDFKVITFTDSSCDSVYVKPVAQ